MQKITISHSGLLSLQHNGRDFISPSPVALLVIDKRAYAPCSADCAGDEILLRYGVADACVRLRITAYESYVKLTVLSVPDHAEGVVFGPYDTFGCSCGEILGAAWKRDGSVVCIQSLMPKVEGGTPFELAADSPVSLTYGKYAATQRERVTLQCSVRDHSVAYETDYFGKVAGYHKHARGSVRPLSEIDPCIAGASVALLTADSAEALLDIISEMELCEGLPHPTYEGEYAKKSKRVSSIYMVLSGAGISAEERIAMAQRAGIRCIYFQDLLDQWGHFTVNTEAYPGGRAEIRALSELAAKSGIDIGTHNLSNFITTQDAYVTPVPHKNLLVMDETTLTRAVSAEARELYIKDANNYKVSGALNGIRLEEELITFGGYDEARGCLVDCTRGAFGTKAAAHGQGTSLYRLWDHPYKTFFPDAELQGEMADNLANALLECGIRRTSFDGLEGCQYTGHGEYTVSEYVRRVFEKVGNELICDASITGNYIWHALSYANWGEPWYDSERRGGQHNLRVNEQTYFKRNLLPAMMGWYKVFDAKGKFEATTPETMEFMLSRSAAFDAGLALTVSARVAKCHGLIGTYLDMVKLWEEFRFCADIPDDVREKLRDEDGNWHLEPYGDGWKLSSLNIRRQDLDYGDQDVETEAGKIYQSGKTDEADGLKHHSSVVCMNTPLAAFDEPFCFRLRVGHLGHGGMKDLAFGPFRFRFDARGGDYLVYRGGRELYHYDANFCLKAVIDGGAEGLPAHEQHPNPYQSFVLFDFQYATVRDEAASYILTTFNTKAEYLISRKKDANGNPLRATQG